MRRALHRVVGLALLGVLSGAPAVAVICAELCTTTLHHEPSEPDDSSCHGRTGNWPAMTAQPAPDCGDHGAAGIGALASLTSRGSHLAMMHPVEASPADVVAAIPSPGHAVTSFKGRKSPPLPTRSGLVLRI